jgi:etoposide-induced 2.4 mRNA
VCCSDSEIRSNVFKSLLLNSLSLTSIYVFDLLLQPLVRDQHKWLHRNVGWFYQTLWLLPVVGVSLYLNARSTLPQLLHVTYVLFQSSWCTLIAKRTFVLQHGSRAANQQPVSYTGMLTMLATSAYRVVMIFTSVVVSFALGSIPFVGPLASFVFLCWVDA